jgi:hypothetical protein
VCENAVSVGRFVRTEVGSQGRHAPTEAMGKVSEILTDDPAAPLVMLEVSCGGVGSLSSVADTAPLAATSDG